MTTRNLLWRGYLAAFFTLVTWTGFSLVSRVGGKSPLTPYDIIALRLITASLVLLPIAWLLLVFLGMFGNGRHPTCILWELQVNVALHGSGMDCVKHPTHT